MPWILAPLHFDFSRCAPATNPHMLAFVLRRIAQAVLVMLAVGLIAFSLFTFVGDPVLSMLGQDATPEARVRITQLRAVQGDFGLSLRQARPVSALFVERLPATLELSCVAALFSLAAGIPMGVYAALKRDTWLAQVFLALATHLEEFTSGTVQSLARAKQRAGSHR